MIFWLTLAGMVAVTFGSRLVGLTLRVGLPAFWLRFLHFVPIAVFAALVTPSLQGARGEGEIRLRGCRGGRRRPGGRGTSQSRSRPGLAVFWLLRVPF